MGLLAVMGRRVFLGVGLSSGEAVWRGFVVLVLVALFGGLWAVFASSARADSHNHEITVTCDGYEVVLSDYDNPSENPAPNRIIVEVDEETVLTQSFPGEFSTTGSLDPNVEQLVIFFVFDPEDPIEERGWSFREDFISPVCEEPTTTATTAVTVTPSTLPFTGAESVSSALLAVVLFGSGALALLVARRAED